MGWVGGGFLDGRSTDAFDPRAVEYFFYKASKPMAEAFDVSVQAMRIRLEQLGLLLVDYARQQSLDYAA
jgi:hypothetical protein